MRMGKSPYRAALEAADEIGLAVIAITFTIIAVFAPVSFMGGIAGQYFKQFGLTVAVAVLFSLLVARLITPMLAAYFMRAARAHEERRTAVIMRAYTRPRRAGRCAHQYHDLRRSASRSSPARSGRRKLLPTGFLPADDSGRSLLRRRAAARLAPRRHQGA